MNGRKVPLGPVELVDSDDDIESFIEGVDDAWLQLMRSTWQRYASRRYADLFDADPVEDTPIADGQA